MSFAQNSAVFESGIIELLISNPIEVVDIGASGTLVEPWATCDLMAGSAFRFMGFEPDQTECNRLRNKAEQSGQTNKTFLPLALWQTDGAEVELHVAHDISTSSVHPPNTDLLDEYAIRHSSPRETKRILSMQAETLDSVLSSTDFNPDFLKIDTQGAEFEILMGARSTLSESCFGCTLETWTTEIHQGQGLTFTVMQLMHDAGFRVFDIQKSAVWQRRSEKPYRKSRGELVGVDILYFKPPNEVIKLPPKKQIKAAILADLWGYRPYAAEILNNIVRKHPDYASAANICLSSLTKLDRRILLKSFGRIRRLLDMALPRLLRVRPIHPDIH